MSGLVSAPRVPNARLLQPLDDGAIGRAIGLNVGEFVTARIEGAGNCVRGRLPADFARTVSRVPHPRHVPTAFLQVLLPPLRAVNEAAH